MLPISYDYAVIRVVPRVDRGEFINAGIVLASARQGFLQAALALDEARLRALDPGADVAAINAALAVFEGVCLGGERAGALGRLSLRERFDWLVAPRSSSVQTSPVHSGRCRSGDLAGTLEHLVRRMVWTPTCDRMTEVRTIN
ncbi:MAG TPA: DUF3037 domain-containing protein [Rubrivivax sp.]|nr:DUF3037 domain-containing protein [Rubrivivax sp.]